jgi:hypothetical protein
MDNADTELERSLNQSAIHFENQLPNNGFQNNSFTQNF